MTPARDTLLNAAGLIIKGARALRTVVDPRQQRRWRKNALSRPSWDDRNRLVATLIRPGQSVLDVGSGAQSLRGYLPPGGGYTPCDRVRISADTLVCDLNRPARLPDVVGFDVAVCSGVCEYLWYPREVLGWVSRVADAAIVTYCPAKGGLRDRFERLAQGWLCHLSESEFQAILMYWWRDVEPAVRWGQHQIYLCRPAAGACSS